MEEVLRYLILPDTERSFFLAYAYTRSMNHKSAFLLPVEVVKYRIKPLLSDLREEMGPRQLPLLPYTDAMKSSNSAQDSNDLISYEKH